MPFGLILRWPFEYRPLIINPSDNKGKQKTFLDPKNTPKCFSKN